MKKSLPLLIGSILCTNAVLSSLSAGMMPLNHADGFQKILGINVAHAEEAVAVKYTCPMHPQVISDTQENARFAVWIWCKSPLPVVRMRKKEM